MTLKKSHLLRGALALTGVATFFQASLAFGEPPPVPQATGDAEMTNFTSDGTAFSVGHLGITITPPAGWNVQTNGSSLSLIMQEPKVKTEGNVKAETITFQRNITMATIHRASPIDEARASELKEEMQRTFAKDSMASEFTVLEHKFFNYKGTNDGLLLYSSMNLGEFKMMQMHVLVSGADKQFLMTYTDLADQFTAAGSPFEQAWNAMVSINVNGTAPQRYADLIFYGSVGSAVFCLLCMGAFWRRRALKSAFHDEDGDISLPSSRWLADEGPSTSVSAVWLLSKKRPAFDDYEDSYVEDAPKSAVSSFY